MKIFLFYGFVLLGLISCGFKGPLYLPSAENKQVTSSVQSNTKKANASMAKTNTSAAIKNNTSSGSISLVK